ncbi:MAG: hypothetical protein KBD37_09270 [Burkholderiales bacterium]|nr:hypothetical protein [Burkholderiales bacterium]
MILAKNIKVLILFILASWLVACSDGTSTTSGGGSSGGSGTLQFAESLVEVTNGSNAQVTLALTNSSGVAGQLVNISTSDASVAQVYPNRCYLSSSSHISQLCKVTVYGTSNGTVNLLAQSDGYTTLSVPVTIGSDIVYGDLEVNNQTSDLTIPYQYGQSITLNGNLLHSSGVSADQNVTLQFESLSGSGVTITPNNQCTVSSGGSNCTVSVNTTLNSGDFQVRAAIIAPAEYATHYTPITITFKGQSEPINGEITISGQNNAGAPLGMSAPIWVNLVNGSGVASTTVTLTSNNPSVIQFYQGMESQINLTNSVSCTISSESPSCGFGIKAQTSSGTSLITAVASDGSYIIESLTVAATTPSTSGRTITFKNTMNTTIWIGITGGSANATLDADGTPAGAAGQALHNTPGGGSMCGPSNPLAACPTGSSCLQGGANPTTSTVYFCYWDQQVPANSKYELAQGESTSIFISSSSIDLTTGGITWSGNYYARQQCDADGNCSVGQCKGPSGGLACGVGTGASPPTVSLAEATYQIHANDYYDVSIINGANYPVQFAPESMSAEITNAYMCGIGGGFESQAGGMTANPVGGLPAATWDFNPPVESAAYYKYVESGGGACGAGMTCSDPSQTCGYNYNAVIGGAKNYQLTCAVQLAWLSADQIWGFNESSSNLAPFPFLESYPNPNPDANTTPISGGTLQLCNLNTFSPYAVAPAESAGSPLLACGGINWNLLGITRPSESVVTTNSNWTNWVLPTITWLKQTCPTCYTYPYDDPSSTFQCNGSPKGNNTLNYKITYGNEVPA